jgi:hypothetical protein
MMRSDITWVFKKHAFSKPMSEGPGPHEEKRKKLRQIFDRALIA